MYKFQVFGQEKLVNKLYTAIPNKVACGIKYIGHHQAKYVESILLHF